MDADGADGNASPHPSRHAELCTAAEVPVEAGRLAGQKVLHKLHGNCKQSHRSFNLTSLRQPTTRTTNTSTDTLPGSSTASQPLLAHAASWTHTELSLLPTCMALYILLPAAICATLASYNEFGSSCASEYISAPQHEARYCGDHPDGGR